MSLAHAEQINFQYEQHLLSGHYLAPLNNEPAKAVLLFVHGDGALTYDADGYYPLIWQTLREHGYAVFSWDKPGVGQSEGNWLKQSMIDRQSEVLSAIKVVQKKYHFTTQNTGLIGFSQAGWVLPALATNNKVGFIIGIGFATSWLEQGQYLTKTRLKLSKASYKQLAMAMENYAKEIAFFKQAPSYADYLSFSSQAVLSPERYQFVLTNFQANASDDYENIDVPTLLLWGEEDLNVNASQEFNRWQSQEKNKRVTTMLIAKANHGLLNSASFNTQDFSFLQWLKLMWLGQEALAPEFLPMLLQWLDKQ